jgi:uncharacterized protein (DUF58 family)
VTDLASQASRRLRAEHLGSTLPPLMIAADRVAATIAQGVHGRRRVGPGETFWQFRQYAQGDTPNSIDWRQSAKSDRVFVREHEWEAAQTVWLWCDRSASMDYASHKNLTRKHARAALLTQATASLLVRGGEYISLLGTDLTPSSGRTALLRLATELETTNPGSLPPESNLPRHADVLWVSDFLNPLPEIEAKARTMAAAGVRGTLVQILDPAEANLPFKGHVRFAGLEGEQDHNVGKADSLTVPYMQRLADRQSALAEMAGRLGWTFLVHHTDTSAQSALLSIYQAFALRPGAHR